ncbi:hypothetical protein ACJMK2_024852 [Sinanodonta woodiana]|uniref:Uncharacterized protein n=1 Tax=Sinanodonta woodiana TaxID=1069815 RepID=A0ABD3XF41_SINWO
MSSSFERIKVEFDNATSSIADEKYFYTVREQDISYHANTILKNVKVTALSKIEWRDVIRGGCFGADCLIVFETGPSNTALDILSGIREREPSGKYKN